MGGDRGEIFGVHRKHELTPHIPAGCSERCGTCDACCWTMLDYNTAKSLIKSHMPVVCSNNGQFATVDHLEGSDQIKLTKDKTGQHHYIPVAWVTAVDDKVHVDRPGDQAMREWKTEPPTRAS